MHGEHSPPSSSTQGTLTPFGAQQMRTQGTAFRKRYFGHPDCCGAGAGGYCGYDVATLDGITPGAIDNSYCTVLAASNSYTIASAAAFMQGLYSPRSPSASSCPEAGQFNGSRADSSLARHRYPNITTVQLGSDRESVFVHGAAYCNKHEESCSTDSNYLGYLGSTRQFYRDLWSAGAFGDSYSLEQASFTNAYDLYQCAAYNWAYSNNTKPCSEEDLDRLRENAVAQQWIKNANLTASGNTEGDMIRGVAGLTVASGALDLFTENIVSCGARNKLNLIFTSHEPFVAFHAVVNAQFLHQPGAPFALELPDPGTAITFELFSHESHDKCKQPDASYGTASEGASNARHPRVLGGNDSGASGGCCKMPEPSYGGYDSGYSSGCDLWVRFIYHDLKDPFKGLSYTMRFEDFNSTVQKFGVSTTGEWCGKCGSNADFCKDEDEDNHAWIVALSSSAVAIVLFILLVVLLV